MGLWLRARIYSKVCAVLNGPAVGAIVTRHTGRAPMWSRSMRGWAVSEKTAADVIAEAEHRGYRVEVHDYRGDALIDLSPVRDTRHERNPDAFEPAQLDLGIGGTT